MPGCMKNGRIDKWMISSLKEEASPLKTNNNAYIFLSSEPATKEDEEQKAEPEPEPQPEPEEDNSGMFTLQVKADEHEQNCNCGK